MNENISKPITLVKEDFLKQLVDLINSTKLPLFVIEYVVKDVLNEVHFAVMRQLQEDNNNYNAQLDEFIKKEDSKEK